MLLQARVVAASLIVGLIAGIPSADAEIVRVEIANLAFNPSQVSAHVGDTIEWVNKDFVAHTATARDRAWDVNLPANGRGSIVLKRTGTMQYYCRFHPNMTGQIVVSK